jgi:uncharacterized membrane protein YgcG
MGQASGSAEPPVALPPARPPVSPTSHIVSQTGALVGESNPAATLRDRLPSKIDTVAMPSVAIEPAKRPRHTSARSGVSPVVVVAIAGGGIVAALLVTVAVAVGYFVLGIGRYEQAVTDRGSGAANSTASSAETIDDENRDAVSTTAGGGAVATNDDPSSGSLSGGTFSGGGGFGGGTVGGGGSSGGGSGPPNGTSTLPPSATTANDGSVAPPSSQSTTPPVTPPDNPSSGSAPRSGTGPVTDGGGNGQPAAATGEKPAFRITITEPDKKPVSYIHAKFAEERLVGVDPVMVIGMRYYRDDYLAWLAEHKGGLVVEQPHRQLYNGAVKNARKDKMIPTSYRGNFDSWLQEFNARGSDPSKDVTIDVTLGDQVARYWTPAEAIDVCRAVQDGTAYEESYQLPPEFPRLRWAAYFYELGGSGNGTVPFPGGSGPIPNRGGSPGSSNGGSGGGGFGGGGVGGGGGTGSGVGGGGTQVPRGGTP